jgi:carbonic anhydrase/acetyltransferase-like protein (isoleucine patch superfamily)
VSGPVFPHLDQTPRVAADAFVAPGAVVVGDVVVEAEASVWFGCVLRGDVEAIRIGARSNIQDGTIIHVASGGSGTHIGEDATIGHRCLLHECRVADRGFVGMGSILLDGSAVEPDAMLAASSLLTQGRRVPSGQLWAGQPARYLRDLRPDELELIRDSAARYVRLARAYRVRGR